MVDESVKLSGKRWLLRHAFADDRDRSADWEVDPVQPHEDSKPIEPERQERKRRR